MTHPAARHVAFRPRKSPSQERSTALVDAIVEASTRVLLRDGYERLTTTAIADVAGVSVGSLYQYFPNKQSVLAEVIRRRADAIVGTLVAIEVEPGDGWRATARKMIAAFLAEKRRMSDLSRTLRDPIAEVDGRGIIRESVQRIAGEVAAVLSKSLGRSLTVNETGRLMIAMAAVEGAVGAGMEAADGSLLKPDFEETIARMFIATLDIAE